MDPIYTTTWQLTIMALTAWGGFHIARRWKSPARLRTWLLVIAALLVSPTIGVSTYLIAIDSFGIVLNWTLFALLFGVLLCMIFKQDAKSSRLSAAS